jgi:selenocysteine lyase/cysteine desulfurase
VLTRRTFLRTGSAAGMAGLVSWQDAAAARVQAATQKVAGRSPEDVSQDEWFWREVQLGFTLDRTITNLNNGGVCPSPRVVHEAFKRYLDVSNQSPAYHMWQVLEPNLETVRRRLAARFGCDPEELAVTRNASEALQISQLGLDLQRGDEVLTTNQDYGRMLDTWDQRARREGVVINKISFPVPPPNLADLATRIERAITPKTRVIHICHITNLTGQIFPVRDICRMARARNIRTIIDGAHAFAHFPFTLADLECDIYGTSLHKWLLAPVGTGFLYVRRELIPSVWPLTATSDTKRADIRKFEEIGTHPAANHLAIAEALVFDNSIGGDRKAARLRYLRRRWSTRVAGHSRVRMHTSDDPTMSCAIGTVGIDGIDPQKLATHLWDKARIIVTPIKHDEFQGIRVTPNVYTTLDEVDAFAYELERVLDKGLPERTA